MQVCSCLWASNHTMVPVLVSRQLLLLSESGKADLWFDRGQTSRCLTLVNGKQDVVPCCKESPDALCHGPAPIITPPEDSSCTLGFQLVKLLMLSTFPGSILLSLQEQLLPGNALCGCGHIWGSLSFPTCHPCTRQETIGNGSVQGDTILQALRRILREVYIWNTKAENIKVLNCIRSNSCNYSKHMRQNPLSFYLSRDSTFFVWALLLVKYEV